MDGLSDEVGVPGFETENSVNKGRPVRGEGKEFDSSGSLGIRWASGCELESRCIAAGGSEARMVVGDDWDAGLLESAKLSVRLRDSSVVIRRLSSRISIGGILGPSSTLSRFSFRSVIV